MKYFLALILTFTLFSTILTKSHAETIECIFTEPFVSTIYNFKKQSLTIDSFDGKKVIKNVRFEIKDAGQFVLVKKNKILQKLNLNYKGSDGMSDTDYPYEVIDTDMQSTSNMGIGGCFSKHLKKTNSELVK